MEREMIEIKARTDEPYRKACKAWGDLQDAIGKVFWWDAWKLRVFGHANLSRRHGELLNRLHDYVEALIESERNA